MKRRDSQLCTKIARRPVVTSTPTFSTSSVTPAPDNTLCPKNDCSPIPGKTYLQVDISSYIPQYGSPTKVKFPRFSSAEGENPLAFIKQCEEYLAVHPLTDNEIIPILSSILEHSQRLLER